MRSLQKKMMDYCVYCPKMCRFSCPVSEATKIDTFTPWGKMQMGSWVLEKDLTLGSENLLPAYQCTNCLHCQNYCEHLNDVPEALREIRKIAVDNYMAPPGAYEMEKNFTKYNNPYPVDLQNTVQDYPLSFFENEDAEIIFFPSCHTLHFFPERIKTYFKLFQKLKTASVAMPPDGLPCCGKPLRDLGFQKSFQDIAEVQFHSLKKYKWIMTDGPECCFSLREHFGELNFHFRKKPIHLLEFLSPYLEHSNYRTQTKMKKRLAYHDPSFLARPLDISDLPRKMIYQLTGFDPLELSWNRKDTLSSGAEGSYEMVFPEVSEKIAQRTLQELSERKIHKLITASSKSEHQFRRLAKGVEIQDIFEFCNEQIMEI